VQRDPIGYEAGDMSLYRYVNNAPQVLHDSCGLQASNATCPVSVAGHFANAYAAARSAAEKAKVVTDFIDLMTTLCGSSISASEAERLLNIEKCKKEPEKSKEKCLDKYPGYESCLGYGGSNAGLLAKSLGNKCTTRNPKKARKCGKGGGTHYMVQCPNLNYEPSILCCNCCDDSTGTAKIRTGCKLTR